MQHIVDRLFHEVAHGYCKKMNSYQYGQYGNKIGFKWNTAANYSYRN